MRIYILDQLTAMLNDPAVVKLPDGAIVVKGPYWHNVCMCGLESGFLVSAIITRNGRAIMNQDDYGKDDRVTVRFKPGFDLQKAIAFFAAM